MDYKKKYLKYKIKYLNLFKKSYYEKYIKKKQLNIILIKEESQGVL